MVVGSELPIHYDDVLAGLDLGAFDLWWLIDLTEPNFTVPINKTEMDQLFDGLFLAVRIL